MSGFLDPMAAKRTLRRIRLRTSLSRVGVEVSRLLDSLDQHTDLARYIDAVGAESDLGLPTGDIDRGIGSEAIHTIESADMREQELLQGVDLILQLLNSLSIDVDQGLFSNRGRTKGIASADAGHCLSEVAK